MSVDTMQVRGLIVLLLSAPVCGKLAPLHRSKDPVPSNYLVRIEDEGEDTVNNFRLALVAENDRNGKDGTGFGHVRIKGEIDGTNLKLFHLELDYKSLDTVRKHPAVLYVEEETRVTMAPVEGGGSSRVARQDGDNADGEGYYGLDRINQIETAPDGNLTFDGDGFGVTVYVVGASIALLHKELDCRARMVADLLDEPGEDCAQRDGTTIASVVAGKGVGVAKAATVMGVKVTDCDNGLSEMNLVKGIQWVIDHGRTPCVTLLGHACPGAASVDLAAQALTESLRSSPDEGCVVVTAAGTVWDQEIGGNACSLSPGRTHGVINVAATNAADDKTSHSFYGPCVDIFAPGARIRTAVREQTVDGDDDYTLSYGTAISAAFVAGAAAIHLGNDVPASNVKERILQDATPCVVGNEGRGSPDRMLYVAPGV